MKALLTVGFALSLLTTLGCGSTVDQDRLADSPSTPNGQVPQNQGAASSNKKSLNYLSKDALAADAPLPAPPASTSEETNTELQLLLKLQESRTAADCTRANTEVNISLDSFFGPAYGPLSQAEVVRLTPFFEKIYKDTKYFTAQAKGLYSRQRPYLEDSDIKPCVPLDPTTSYPSGHTTASRVFADVLGALDPAHKEQYLNRANQVAQDRVLGGMHHPSDIAAGKILGDEIFNALEQSASFEADFKSAR